jgi:hypothetical protein
MSCVTPRAHGRAARPELAGGASLTVTFDKRGVVVGYAQVW